jgi:hypothetical protein
MFNQLFTYLYYIKEKMGIPYILLIYLHIYKTKLNTYVPLSLYDISLGIL